MPAASALILKIPTTRPALLSDMDLINQPPHYRQGEIECIDAIEAAWYLARLLGKLEG